MLTTLYTDASYSSHTEEGGWGVWARSDHGRLIKSGACPDYVSDSNDAELAAMFAGIHLIGQNWPGTKRILICSDSQVALGWVMDEKRIVRRPGTARLQKKIRKVCIEHGFAITPRWVKGHTGASTTQAYLNAKCDEFAGQARLRQQRRRGR